MNKIKFFLTLGAILTIAILTKTVHAQDYNASANWCYDNSTLMMVTKIFVPERNATRTIEIPKYCEFGCDFERNTCNYAPWIKYAIIIGVCTLLFLAFKFVFIPLTGK